MGFLVFDAICTAPALRRLSLTLLAAHFDSGRFGRRVFTRVCLELIATSQRCLRATPLAV